MSKNIHVDFVIVLNGRSVGYLSTNMACPVWGYKQNSTFLECIDSLRESFPGFSYTREGIIPNAPHSREFTEKDKIYVNKINNRLNKALSNNIKIKEFRERER